MLKNRSYLQRIALIFTDMYGLYISLLVIIWLVIDEALFFTLIFVSLMPAIFYLSPIMLIIALWIRSRHTLILLCVPILAFATLYFPVFMPRDVQSVDGIDLSVLTYNVHAENFDLLTTLDLIQNMDADVVALQEVNRMLADGIEQSLAEQYPYQVRFTVDESGQQVSSNLTVPTGNFSPYTGRMILSKYPVSDPELVSINQSYLYMLADVAIEDEIITVNNVHFPLPLSSTHFFDSTRIMRQAQNVLDNISDRRTIIAGDFNATEQSNLYTQMTLNYADTFRATATGFGNTFPNEGWGVINALLRIDYIFVSDDITPQFAEVHYEGVSDHYPLYAEVILN